MYRFHGVLSVVFMFITCLGIAEDEIQDTVGRNISAWDTWRYMNHLDIEKYQKQQSELQKELKPERGLQNARQRLWHPNGGHEKGCGILAAIPFPF